MDVLIAGSVAYDSLKTPYGSVEDALGGSATHAGISAALRCDNVGLLSRVGKDFKSTDVESLQRIGIDTSMIEIVDGITFRWKGEYEGDMSEARTLETSYNVLEGYSPRVDITPQVLFCANLDPRIQLHILQEVKPTRCTILDSMNLWINTERNHLLKAMAMVDIVVINQMELSMLTGEEDLFIAHESLLKMIGDKIVIIKRGGDGVFAFIGNSTIELPACNDVSPVDPTGCGDSFAGSLAAILSQRDGVIEFEELREALVKSTVNAGLTLEGMGCQRLLEIDLEDLSKRTEQHRSSI